MAIKNTIRASQFDMNCIVGDSFIVTLEFFKDCDASQPQSLTFFDDIVMQVKRVQRGGKVYATLTSPLSLRVNQNKLTIEIDDDITNGFPNDTLFYEIKGSSTEGRITLVYGRLNCIDKTLNLT